VAKEPRHRDRKADPALDELHRTAKLTRENERLRRKLAQAREYVQVKSAWINTGASNITPFVLRWCGFRQSEMTVNHHHRETELLFCDQYQRFWRLV